MAPSRRTLQGILEQCGIRLEDQQLDQLWAYHRLLREADAELNLTRIRNFENMVLKHYVDSLLVLEHTRLPATLVDMGTGPGLPGIPLKIARPQVAMILAEPRGARAEFLDRVVAELGLEGVEVYAGKVGPRFPRTARGVITRAVASIPETLEMVAGVVEPGGSMIFMKGPGCDGEVAEASRTAEGVFRLVKDVGYEIPGTTHRRRLVEYRRMGTAGGGVAGSGGAPVKEITSAANPTFKMLRDVLSTRGIRKERQALVAGTKVVAEVVARHGARVEAWVTSSGGPPPPEASILWLRVADALFRELDVAGTHAPLLLVSVPELPAWSAQDPWPAGCTLFVPFQDPENVGAVIRTAAAFGVPRVVLLREAAHPFHPKAARAAGTALFEVELSRGPSITELETEGTPLLALAMTGVDLEKAPFPERFGLVAGLEGPGLPAVLLQGAEVRRIPIVEGVESLNAATAVAVALYAWSRGKSSSDGGESDFCRA